jgi:hypothetical protein
MKKIIEDGMREDPVAKKVYFGIDDHLSESSCCSDESQCLSEDEKKPQQLLSVPTDS